ncbi:ABC transporter permease [Boseaceae bacterium BT-24-1]|nr:ABC transporter permease [Boseaceae bacterium BT-24-1]
MIVQGALLFGVVGTNALYVTRSQADLWVGFPGTLSVDLGRAIGSSVAADLYLDPRIIRIEPFLLGTGDWRGARGGGTSVTVVGIDARPDGLGLAAAVPARTRLLLQEPGTVLVDDADLDKLETGIGRAAEINGRLVRIVGATAGLRSMGGVNVVSSIDTARSLDVNLGGSDDVTYYLVRTTNPRLAQSIRQHLTKSSTVRRFDVWTSEELAARSVRYWLMESGAGVGFLFATAIAILVGTLVTSQTLMAAVAASVTQYATLRALGVPFKALKAIVVEQAGWVGLCGLLIGAAFSLAAAAVARMGGVPFELSVSIVAIASLVVVAVALAAGLLALRRLQHVDPATLLR